MSVVVGVVSLVEMHSNKRPRQDDRKTKKQPLSCAECRRCARPCPAPPRSPRPRLKLKVGPRPRPRPVLTPRSAIACSPASPARSAGVPKYAQTVRAPLPPLPVLTPHRRPHLGQRQQVRPSPPRSTPLTPRQVHPRKHRAAPCKDNTDERSYTPARGRPWLPPRQGLH